MKSGDKLFFSSIKIDSINIYVGKDKILINNSGIYNQVANYLSSKEKSKVGLFLSWLQTNHGDGNKGSLEASILAWEDNLRDDSKGNLCSEVFRIKYTSLINLEFYVMINDGTYDYLTNNSDKGMYNKLIKYLQYNYNIHDVVESLGCVHPLDMTKAQIEKDIKQALRYNIIPKIKLSEECISQKVEDERIFKYNIN